MWCRLSLIKLLILFAVVHVESIINATDGLGSSVSGEDDLIKQWQLMENATKNMVEFYAKNNLMPFLEDLFNKTNISIKCRDSIIDVINKSTLLEKWSLQMLDSSGKFPASGTIEGTLGDIGRYDECLDARNEENTISGQYCSFLLYPPLPRRPRFHTICNKIPQLMNTSRPGKLFKWIAENAHYFYYVPIRIGLCTPSTCSGQDVHSLVETASKPFHLNVTFMNNRCEVKHSQSLNGAQIFVSLMFLMIILTTIIGTVFDVLRVDSLQCCKSTISNASKVLMRKLLKRVDLSPNIDRSNSSTPTNIISVRRQWILMFTCFSVRRNTASLLNIDDRRNGDDDSLHFLHGFRVLTMSWIIFGHTWGLINATVYTNTFQASNMYSNIFIQGVLNATLGVDTFFFISGLLTIYGSWKQFTKTSKFQPFMFTSLRYLRLTPAYTAVIGFTFLFPLIGSGPLWTETVDQVTSPCYKTWWTNLLYVNNFVMPDKMCLMHSWYLSDDFQYHLLALIIIFALIKSRKIGFSMMACIMLCATMYSALVTAINNYPPTIVSTSPVVDDRWQYILDFYYKPWPHLCSYCIGLIVGYLIATKKCLQLSKRTNLLCWTICAIGTVTVLYGVYPWNIGLNVNPGITAVYASTFRTVWTANCAWITLVLYNQKQKGLMYECLSWKWLLPLSRLTFMAYLLHPFVVWFNYGTMRERMNPGIYPLTHTFCGNYLITYVSAFIFGVLFESPFIAVIKQLMKSNKSGINCDARSECVSNNNSQMRCDKNDELINELKLRNDERLHVTSEANCDH